MATETLIKNLVHSLSSADKNTNVRLFETHISWIILTGKFAYKIKKPVDFGFLNYSTLEKRKFYCQEEIRLNRVLDPDIYLDVVAITGSENAPQLNGSGNVIEYAVKMHEFPQSALFSTLAEENQLTPEMIDELAQLIAKFHATTPIAAPQTILGTPKHVHAPVKQNFEQILPLLTSEEDKKQLAELEKWSNDQYKKYFQLFNARKQHGYIRDCHGDLHLGNIIYYHNKPIIFDRIEFNEDLRWTDVIADIAFLAMDIADRGFEQLANRLLNVYFSATGDYEGIALLPYYQVYRAVVRAKIALFRLAHASDLSDTEKEAIRHNYRKLIALALIYTKSTPPSLIIMHGLTRSGKSFIAQKIVEKHAAFQISSDVERKRLFHMSPTESGKAPVNKGIYSPRTTEMVYKRLAEIATIIISAGYSVVIDATFLQYKHRQLFHDLANQIKVPYIIINCDVSQDALVERIKPSNVSKNDPSDTYMEVLEMQIKALEPLKDSEKKFIIDHTIWLG